MDSASVFDAELAGIVKAKVDEELANIISIIEERESRSVSKTVKELGDERALPCSDLQPFTNRSTCFSAFSTWVLNT